MRLNLAWFVILAVLATCSCRELIGVDEALLDPALSDTASGGQGGDEG